MPRPMLRVPKKKYHYNPYKTQTIGFNTEFSLENLKSRLRNNLPLSLEEQVYIDYLESKGLL